MVPEAAGLLPEASALLSEALGLLLEKAKKSQAKALPYLELQGSIEYTILFINVIMS